MRALGLVLVLSALFGAGCGWHGAVTPPGPVVTASAPTEATTPEWRTGDRWVYEWISGQERGTRTNEVLKATKVNGVDFYVVDIGDGVQQYYTMDLHFAAGVQASRVLARMVPPQPWFVWPLKTGAQWKYQGVYEEQQGSKPHNDTFEVVASERVSVPGGAFQTFKVVRQTDGRDSDQYWYAPDVRWYVRWIGRRGDIEFTEDLKAYQPVPRITSIPSKR